MRARTHHYIGDKGADRDAGQYKSARIGRLQIRVSRQQRTAARHAANGGDQRAPNGDEWNPRADLDHDLRWNEIACFQIKKNISKRCRSKKNKVQKREKTNLI